MSWRNAFASFAILALVVVVVCGTGQAFARPADGSMVYSGFSKVSPGHANDDFKTVREMRQMRPVPTIFPVPKHEKKAELVEGFTDKRTYEVGDKVTGSVVLKNTGSVVIEDVTINVKAYKQTPLGYVYIGSKSETLSNLKITPGMVKKLDRHVKIPNKYSRTLVSGDYKLDVTAFSGASEIGSFTAYATIK